MNPSKRTGWPKALVLLGSCSLIMSARADAAWEFELTPYLWGATIGGDVAASSGTDISAPAPGDSSFFSLENLQAAAFLALEAKRDQWRILADAAYVRYEGDVRNGPLITVSEDISGFIFELGGGYQLQPDSPWEVLGGVRYFDVQNKLDSEPGATAETRKTWADPYLGMRFTHALSDRWRLRARADIGGFGVSADLMQNYVLDVDYRLNDWANLRVGYRYLSTDFQRDRFGFDVSLKGPAIGLAIDW